MTMIFESRSEETDRFRRLLDEQNDWPSPFTFKFIVPKAQLDELSDMLGDHELQQRPSSKGNYVSVTLSPMMNSSEEVIEVYSRVSGIEGLVAL